MQNQNLDILFIYLGILDGNLFLQIANEKDKILYSAETLLQDHNEETFISAMSILLGEEFKKSGLAKSLVETREANGIQLNHHGKAVEADDIPKGTFKKLTKTIHANLNNNTLAEEPA